MQVKLFLAAVAVCLTPWLANAQEVRHVATSYSYLRNGGANLNGWSVDGGILYAGVDPFGGGDWAAIGVDVSVSRHSGTKSLLLDERTDTHSNSKVQRTSILAGVRLAGSRFKWPGFCRISAGYSERAFEFLRPDGVIATRQVRSPAIGLGAGLDIPISDRVVLQAVHVDTFFFPGDSRARTGVRVSSGVGIWW